MLSAFFLNKRYIFWSYGCTIFSLLVIWLASFVGLQMTNLSSDYSQLLSDCSTKKIQCTITTVVDPIIYTILPRVLFIALLSALYSYCINISIFNWRQALTEYYMTHWKLIRNVEGASQRIQEDTELFARKCRGMFGDTLSTINRAFIYIPLLFASRDLLPEVFIFGNTSWGPFAPLISVAIVSFLFVIIANFKIPSLFFESQLREAAFRKELVAGEESEERAQKDVVDTLYDLVRINTYQLIAWFSISRLLNIIIGYIGGDLAYLFYWPSFFHGKLTLKSYTQIKIWSYYIEAVFQWFTRRWRDISILISIYLRLKTFEDKIKKAKKDQKDLEKQPLITNPVIFD